MPTPLAELTRDARVYRIRTDRRTYDILATSHDHARDIVHGRAFTYGTPPAPQYDQPCRSDACPITGTHLTETPEWKDWYREYGPNRFAGRLNIGERALAIDDLGAVHNNTTEGR